MVRREAAARCAAGPIRGALCWRVQMRAQSRGALLLLSFHFSFVSTAWLAGGCTMRAGAHVGMVALLVVFAASGTAGSCACGRWAAGGDFDWWWTTVRLCSAGARRSVLVESHGQLLEVTGGMSDGSILDLCGPPVRTRVPQVLGYALPPAGLWCCFVIFAVRGTWSLLLRHGHRLRPRAATSLRSCLPHRRPRPAASWVGERALPCRSAARCAAGGGRGGCG